MNILIKAGSSLLGVWLLSACLFLVTEQQQASCTILEGLVSTAAPCRKLFQHTVLPAISNASTTVMVSLLILFMTVFLVDTCQWLADHVRSIVQADLLKTCPTVDKELSKGAPPMQCHEAAHHPVTICLQQGSAAGALSLQVLSGQEPPTAHLQPAATKCPAAAGAGIALTQAQQVHYQQQKPPDSMQCMVQQENTVQQPNPIQLQQQHHLAAPQSVPAQTSCASPADVDGCGVVDVWVLAGQSNCVGWNQADGQEMPAAAAPLPGRILKFDRQGCCWQTAVPNVHLGVYGYTDADSCGPAMTFARTLIQTGAARKVGLVPTACGGTNLYEQWRPGGELWSNMVEGTTAAMDSLGVRGRLAGIIWVQGESDAFTQETAAAYSANFTAWLAATRAALQAYCPCVPLVMAVMAVRQREGAFPFIATVAEQQRGLKLPGVLQVEMAGHEFYDGGDGNLVHLTKDGCCALGAAMAYEVAASRLSNRHW